MRRRKSMGIIQAIALAAGAAALGAAFSFIGAAFSFLNTRGSDNLDTLVSSSSSGRIVSRTLRSTSVQTSVGCGRTIQQQRETNVAEVQTPNREVTNSITQLPSTVQPVYASTSAGISQALMSRSDNANAVPSDGSSIQNSPNDDQKLGIAWLMSFPNSGTSYTIHLIRETTNTTTATNYALEGDIKDEASVPAIPGSEEGPFLELIKTIQTKKPTTYILTKTHCGGFCSNCLPVNYIETPRSFQISCLSGRRAVESKDSNSTNGVVAKPVRYKSDIVKRAVHVMRSPFDNIVARFHLEQKRHRRVGDTEWLTAHPNDKEGFQKWCSDVDESTDLMDARWTDPELSEALEGVPCHQEFYRYIQWHNLAFTTARDIGIPTFVLHYEDYSDRFDGVLADLLAFLELEQVSKGPDFDIGKQYHEFYTDEQREAVAKLVKELASLETWFHMKDYYFSSIPIRTE